MRLILTILSITLEHPCKMSMHAKIKRVCTFIIFLFQIFGRYHRTQYIIDMTSLIRHVVSNYNEVVQNVKGIFINRQIL